MKTSILLVLIIVFFGFGCGRSNKDRLAHDWMVEVAHSSHSGQETETDGQVAAINSADEFIKQEFVGRLYKIKEDGSFIQVHKGELQNGTWENNGNEVNFTIDGVVTEKWFFKHGIEVFGDMSIRPDATIAGYEYPITFKLKPVEGQHVETDF